jgi:fatty-acid desaturase
MAPALVPASSSSRPWYRRGGMHVTEPAHAISMFYLQYVLMNDILGKEWGAKHLAYLCGMALCYLAAQRPRGGVDPDRWPFVCIVMPTYFAGLLLIPSLCHPLLCCGCAFALIVAKIGICMSVCLHRYAAHQAFRCGPSVAFFLHWVGCLANQGGALWWAANHRCHHKFCDVDARTAEGPNNMDPHSPKLDGLANAFAFFGGRDHGKMKEEFAPRHCDSLATRILDTFNFVPWLLELYVYHRVFGGEGLWVACIGSWGSQCLTLWFNVVNHMPATPRETGCGAVDVKTPPVPPNVFFWLLTQILFVTALFGEDRHDHHHTYGQLAHRPGLDLPFHLFVRPLGALGLIWNVTTDGRMKPVSSGAPTKKRL